jgi:hypothetical protein
MALAQCFDAAFPPAKPPLGAAAALGYLGGRATHVWTHAEWLRVAHLRQFPAWVLAVGGQVSGDPVDQADEAVARMRQLGWHTGRALVGDMETSTDTAYWRTFQHQVIARGMTPVCYASLGNIAALAPKHKWAAHYGAGDQLAGDEWALQYTDTGTVDWSVVAAELISHGGIGPRLAA